MNMPAYNACDHDVHAAIKDDVDRWYRDTYPLGVQVDNEIGSLELRQCRTCHSTLARRLPGDAS